MSARFFALTTDAHSLTLTVLARVTEKRAEAIADALPKPYAITKTGPAAWALTRDGNPVQHITIGEPHHVVTRVCELQHFGKGVTATTCTTVQGSMCPGETHHVYACDECTPTLADTIAHNAKHGETIDYFRSATLDGTEIENLTGA
ncbi:hypothetical protein ACFXG4_48540 [Nocardia sp. NPDC059246]|uniref:hypothetical protein n=1 Tax=unclassified Nocardia TaxID=2637762 RepID=UPI0036B623DE